MGWLPGCDGGMNVGGAKRWSGKCACIVQWLRWGRGSVWWACDAVYVWVRSTTILGEVSAVGNDVWVEELNGL
jgi:hypothetical protein